MGNYKMSTTNAFLFGFFFCLFFKMFLNQKSQKWIWSGMSLHTVAQLKKNKYSLYSSATVST